MKTAIVIEDQTILRDLVVRLLEEHGVYQVVAAVGDGEEGYRALLKHRPDFVILDIVLPGLNGVEIFERIKRDIPDLKVLVFSGSSKPAVVRQALQAGVLGFIEKTAGLESLEKGIALVSNGETYFGPEIQRITRELMMSPSGDGSLSSLSAREREIVKLIAESFTTKEIAGRLHISPKTVETHRSNIMQKLNVHDVAGITRFAISNGMVDS